MKYQIIHWVAIGQIVEAESIEDAEKIAEDKIKALDPKAEIEDVEINEHHE